MPLSLKNPGAEELARELPERTCESVRQAVTETGRERLKTLEQPATGEHARQRVESLLREFDALPELDFRERDEILGYDEQGLP